MDDDVASRVSATPSAGRWGPRQAIERPASATPSATGAGAAPPTLEPAGAVAPGYAASSAFTEGSWARLPNEALLDRVSSNFDVTTESLQDYERRVFRAVAILEVRGMPVDEALIRKSVLRARYAMETAGLSDPEAARLLRAALGQLLEEDAED
eukprot:6398640-Heterocapsa_arctica.AAC.1